MFVGGARHDVAMTRQWGSAWRVFAALPFVLLCAILALKVGNARMDPTASPAETSPSVQLTQDLGDDAPDAGVRATPGATGTTGSVTDLPSDLLTSDGATLLPTESASTDDDSAAPSPTRSSTAPKPTKSTQSSSPSPSPTTQSPSPTQSSTPTPLTPREKCLERGGRWNDLLKLCIE